MCFSFSLILRWGLLVKGYSSFTEICSIVLAVVFYIMDEGAGRKNKSMAVIFVPQNTEMKYENIELWKNISNWFHFIKILTLGDM